MDEFLSDWEDPGMPVPWTIGEHALPNPILSSIPETTLVNAERETVPQGAAPLLVPIAAVPPGIAQVSVSAVYYDSVFADLSYKGTVKVMLLPDYAATGPRLADNGAIWRELQMLMPRYEVHTCMCVGPFTDDYGNAAFFDKTRKHLPKQIMLDVKRDMLTSVVAV